MKCLKGDGVMSEFKTVTLSIDLSVMINKELISKGMRRSDIKSFDKSFTSFCDYELEAVDALCITNCFDISELINLPNLKKLHIKSADYNKLAPSIDYRDSCVINHVQDFSVIYYLTGLEELVIANDLYVKTLDISKLVNLKKLI